jgi:hypothetical protein
MSWRRILAGLLNDTGKTFDESELLSIRSLAAGALDRILYDLLEGVYSEEELRGALVPLSFHSSS